MCLPWLHFDCYCVAELLSPWTVTSARWVTGVPSRGMKLNASKTKTMIISRSRTILPGSLQLTINGTVLQVQFQVTLIYLEWKHLRSVSRAASQSLGILRSWREFNDGLIIERCFLGFFRFVLKYCSAVWCSATDIHIKLVANVRVNW